MKGAFSPCQPPTRQLVAVQELLFRRALLQVCAFQQNDCCRHTVRLSKHKIACDRCCH
jgi:hypothetical protein